VTKIRTGLFATPAGVWHSARAAKLAPPRACLSPAAPRGCGAAAPTPFPQVPVPRARMSTPRRRSPARSSPTVRLLVYNIRYATGTGPAFHLPVPGAGYLRSNRKVLSGITEFIRSESPDVVGLVEVDTGSIRTGMLNQAQHIAGELGHYSTYQCKYGAGSINQLMPSCASRATPSCPLPTCTASASTTLIPGSSG